MNRIKSLLITILGTMLTGMGIGVFLTPNKIVGGGASGLPIWYVSPLAKFSRV